MIFLHPLDILRLRKTCKSLHSVTVQRSVWVRALKKVMNEHYIPRFTFDFESLSRQRLEHAALSPTRFRRLIDTFSGQEHKVPYRSSRMIVISEQERAALSIPYSEIANFAFADISLVPGGRYLVSVSHKSMKLKASLQLWDVGLGGHNETITLVAHHVLPESKARFPILEICASQPMAGGSGLHVVINSNDPGSPPDHQPASSSMLSAYSIILPTSFPLRHVPKWTLLGQIKVKDYIHSSTKGTRTACLFDKNKVIVWDFFSGTAMSWEATEYEDFSTSSSIQLYQDSLLMFGGKILIYPIPHELPPCPPDLQFPSNPQDALLAIANPGKTVIEEDEDDEDDDPPLTIRPNAIYFRSPGEVSGPNSQPLELFGVVDSQKFIVHEMRTFLPTSISRLSPQVPIRIDVLENRFSGPHRPWTQYGPLQRCDDRIVLHLEGRWGAELTVAMFNNPFSNKGLADDPGAYSVASLEHPESCRRKLSVCAAAGRVCFLNPQGKAFVLDYLEPLEEFP